MCRDRVFLTNKLISLRQRLVGGDNSVVDLIQDVECRLKAIYTKEIEGILVRSRAEWLEEGERPTRYFFVCSLLTHRKAKYHRFMIHLVLRSLLGKRSSEHILISILPYFLKSRLI